MSRETLSKSRVVAVYTRGRMLFSDTADCAAATLSILQIPLVPSGGPMWPQAFTGGIEAALQLFPNADYILTYDGDSLFIPEDVERLIAHLDANPDLSVVFAQQQSRHYNTPLCCDSRLDYRPDLTIQKFGHFGLTLIRRGVFDNMPQPWFISLPNTETGRWEGHCDADIAFWNFLDIDGKKVAQANDVVIGHIELCVLWPVSGTTAIQLMPNFAKNGRPGGIGWRIAPRSVPEGEQADTSQWGEYRVLRDILGDSKGRFLDIGAFDGVSCSNVYPLAKEGWNGVCIEPSPASFAKLQKNYAAFSGVTLACAAVLPEPNGRLTTLLDSGDYFSTVDPALAESIRKDQEAGNMAPDARAKHRPVDVAALGVNDILERYGEKFDVVSIDAEGISPKIACAMPYDRMGCRVLVVEHEGHADGLSEALCARWGFTEKARNQTNLVLAREP